ncbi:MAG: ORF6N domain-containing protein [Bacteroidales bacterium]|nr:ORF6N domain-containing protein [Candidatus Colicola coprequi]
MPKSKEIVSTKSTEHIVVNLHPSEQHDVENSIFTIRGVQVMLDSDLARFYGITTGNLNKSVKRNIKRFPEDFMFQLTKEEVEDLRFHFGTLNNNANSSRFQFGSMNGRGHNVKYLPYVFTEEGVSQLSGVLHSETAEEVSVRLIRAFVAMRRYIATHAGIFQRLDSLEQFRLETKQSLALVEHKFDNLLSRLDDGSVKPIEGIFVEGQVLDARIYLEQLIGSAKKEIILIDGYIDARTFDILEARKQGVKATIYTESVGRKLLAEAQAHDAEYPGRQIELKAYNNRFHDRFLIVDDDLYHFGASFNELGKRLFAFDKMGIDKGLILSQL